MKKVKPRKASAEYANKLMSKDILPINSKHHFGKTHLRMLMDYIYCGKPVRKDQEIK